MDALRLRFEGKWAVPKGVVWDGNQYREPFVTYSPIALHHTLLFKGYQAAWADAVKEREKVHMVVSEVQFEGVEVIACFVNEDDAEKFRASCEQHASVKPKWHESLLSDSTKNTAFWLENKAWEDAHPVKEELRRGDNYEVRSFALLPPERKGNANG